MTNARKVRGMATQRIVADDLRSSLWPYVESTGAGRQGADLTGTPGVCIEIKARRALDLPGWLAQAQRNALLGGGLAVLIVRPDGYGEAKLSQWPVVLRYEDWRRLMASAGYGSGEALGVDQGSLL